MKQIKLFLTDVDGCLTDGGLYYSANGDELKRFCVYDGMGMALLQQAGVVGCKIEKAPCYRYVPATAEPVEQPTMTKREAVEQICKELGISMKEVCYVGDDVNDLDLLEAVGHPCCPPSARPEVLRVPGIHVTMTPGGQGAIRELTDEILAARTVTLP